MAEIVVEPVAHLRVEKETAEIQLRWVEKALKEATESLNRAEEAAEQIPSIKLEIKALHSTAKSLRAVVNKYDGVKRG